MSANRRTEIMEGHIDVSTNAVTTVEYPHAETHGGSRYFVQYSVPSLGAMTSPNDTITLTFKTSNTKKWDHFIFIVTGSSGFRIRLIEAPSGGAASATGTLPILNKNRNYQILKQSTTSNGTTEGVVDYDATLATGGVSLWDDYIAGSTTGQSGSGATGKRDELILKQNTVYQLSVFGTDTEAAALYIDWYEHTNKD